MIKILNEGQTIEYTKGDTFELEVEADEAIPNSTLKFTISTDETSLPIIDSQFSYTDDKFEIILTSREKESLDVGNYIFKLSLTDSNGKIITYLSGDFIVKWGA